MEKEIEVAAAGATTTSESVTRLAVAEARNEFKAQFDQIRAESQRREGEMARQVDEVAQGLSKLTEQLNPASVGQVQGSQGELSAAVEARLNLQSSRIDAVDESVTRTEKTAADNAEILHNLLVGIENLSDNVKQLSEEVRGYGDPEAQKDLDDMLLKEVEETFPVAMDQVPISVPSSIALVSSPLTKEPVSLPILSSRPASSSMGEENKKM